MSSLPRGSNLQQAWRLVLRQAQDERVLKPARIQLVNSRRCLTVLAALIAAATSAVAAPEVRELRWAGDAEGGAPFVEANPARPGEVVGFDVDIAGLMAKGIGRTPRFVMITFSSIDQSIERDDADIGMSGIEDTPARRATRAVTIPYYEFREVLSVRPGDAGALRSLQDLRGKNVATLGGTIA